MASGAYNQAKVDLLKKVYDLSTDALKIMLVQTGYTFDPTHVYVSSITSVTNNELNSGGGGTGYAAGFSGTGRKTLATQTVTIDNTNNRGVFSAANVTWTAINAGTARAAVIYKAGTTDDDSKMLFYCQFPADAVTAGGDLTIAWSANGIAYLS